MEWLSAIWQEFQTTLWHWPLSFADILAWLGLFSALGTAYAILTGAYLAIRVLALSASLGWSVPRMTLDMQRTTQIVLRAITLYEEGPLRVREHILWTITSGMTGVGLSLIAFILASSPIAPDWARIAFLLFGVVMFQRNIYWMRRQRHALSMAADLETTDIDALERSANGVMAAAKAHSGAGRILGWPFSMILGRQELATQEYIKATQRYAETARRAQQGAAAP